MAEPIVVSIRDQSDIIAARQAGRALARQLGFSSMEQTRLATAISELTRNVVEHAGEGSCSIVDAKNSAIGIRVTVEDHGPGIVDLDRAMQDGFSTTGGMGAGLPGTKRLVDEFSSRISAGPHEGLDCGSGRVRQIRELITGAVARRVVKQRDGRTGIWESAMAANPHSIACLGDHLSKRPAETAGTSKDERPTPSVLEATVEAYRQALAQYLASQDESQLVRAYEAGRKALADGLCVLDMAHVHLQAFEQILEEYCGVWDGSRIRAIANSFFMESLGPYEMTRSALEENVCFIDSRALKLVQRIEQLQAEVSERRELEVRLARLTDHERNRLGRELHDNLGQQLSGVGLLAVTLECELTRLGSSQAALAKRLAEYVEKTQVQLRQVIRGVLPVEVPVSGFRFRGG